MTPRSRRSWLDVALILVATSGCKPGSSAGLTANRSRSASAPSTVSGVVVDTDRWPLAGRTVLIGEERTTTDSAGRFVLTNVPDEYAIAVADADGAMVTLFKGLHRPDLVLVHETHHTYVKHARQADITGTLAGDPNSVGDVIIRFSAHEAEQEIDAGGGRAVPSGDFGPLRLSWDGPDAISGDVVAFRRDGAPAPADDSGWIPAWSIARRATRLRDGDHRRIELSFAPVKLTRVVGRIEAERGTSRNQVQIYYRARGSHKGLWMRGARGGQPTSYDWLIPDLRDVESPCVQVSGGDQGRWILELQCDVPLDQPIVQTLRAPPEFQSPASGSPLRADTQFSWSAIAGAIYALELEPIRSGTPVHPHVTIYTSDTLATWPGAGMTKIPFPIGAASYKVRAIARGAYASIDDAVGPEGFAAPVPKMYWMSESREMRCDIDSTPPANIDPSCRFPYRTVIVCGDPVPGDPEGGREHYMLSPINDTLQRYPDLAATIGISCVRDCETARKYMKGYHDYRQGHPMFDFNKPMGEH